MFEPNAEIQEYIDRAIDLGRLDSKKYNNGETNDSFALGHLSAGMGFLLMDLKLNKRQMAELNAKVKEINKRLAE